MRTRVLRNGRTSVQVHLKCSRRYFCSQETSAASMCAGESHYTSCPHCGDPLDDVFADVLIICCFAGKSYVV
jgi:hypothetical protein